MAIVIEKSDLTAALMKCLTKHFKNRDPLLSRKFDTLDINWRIPVQTNNTDLVANITPASSEFDPSTGHWSIHVHPLLNSNKLNAQNSFRGFGLKDGYRPDFVLQYIIFHELIHIYFGPDLPQHSADFLTLEKQFKSRDKARDWLSNNGYCLVENYE